MQSFIQYRTLGRRLQQELDRKGPSLRPQGNGRLNTDASQLASTADHPAAAPPAANVFEPDVEKAAGEPDSSEEEKEEVEPQQPEGADDGGHDIEALGTTISRVSTKRSTRTLGTQLGHSMTGVQVRDRNADEGGDDATRQVFVVGFQGDADPMNPHNWSNWARIGATANIAAIGWVVGFASAIDSSILRNASEEFGVSTVTESMATGLYLIGFGAGSLFAGPISETIGRNPVYIATMTLYMIFIMASGLAPNIGAQLAFRFLAGFFGSTPLTCAGGSVADMWDPMERVFAFPIFANAAFMGPIIGPVVGGFIGDPSSLVNWRWTEWSTLIISGVVLALVVFLQPETYTPVLLRWKAQHLRQKTGDARFVAPIEVRAETFLQRVSVALYRPFLLTIFEPMVQAIALYLTVVYIILFTFLDGYDFIFGETGGIHGLRPSLQGLCFLGIALGLFVASALVPLIYRWAKRDLAQIKARGGTRLPPEFRLWFAMFGGPAIPISLFWMGWTSDTNISIWSPLVASVVFGYGILCVFISCYQYIIDSYEIYAASALASMTLLRYAVSGGMVVVGIPFYQNLGVHYTLTILACISAALVPLPYVFFKFGPQIRRRSRYAATSGEDQGDAQKAQK